MGRDEGFELADEGSVPAESQLGVDPLLERGHSQLVQSRRLRTGELLLVEIGERRAAPEGERLAQEGRPRRLVGAARGGEQPFEAVRVDVVGLEREPVTRSLGQHDVAAEQLPERRDGVLERAGRRRGRPLTPQVGDEPVGRDDLARPQGECGEQRPLLAARQCHGALAVAHLERAEEANLHLHLVTPKTSVSK